MFLPIDNQNLLNLLEEQEKPHDERGNLSQEELEQIIDTREIDPIGRFPVSIEEYIKNLVIHYKNEIPLYPNIRWENQFAAYFYDVIKQIDNAFLQEWFTFEQNFNNLVTGIIANNYEVEVDKELVGNNEFTEAIKTIKAKDFGLGNDHDFVEKVLNAFDTKNLLEREKQLDQIKWDKLDDLTTFDYFSIEVVMAYMFKTGILERWQKLDKETGKKIFNQLIQDLKNSYEFPEYFVA
jgi:hypothetical protein